MLRTPQCTHYLLTSSDSLPATMTQYQHVAITLRSRQLLKMGTWLPETCWATCKGEKKDNTKWHLVGFLSHTELRCTVNHRSYSRFCWILCKFCSYIPPLVFLYQPRSMPFCVMSFLSIMCMQDAMREIFRFPLLHDNGCGFTALILTCRPSSTTVTATLFIIRSELITRKVCRRNTFLTSAGLL